VPFSSQILETHKEPKKIVESQGGAITVESAEGRGASFRFTWPKQASA
jgi:signal transduction histidine kinase